MSALNSGALKEPKKASRSPVSSTWKAPCHSLVPTTASQPCWTVEESCHSFFSWNRTSPLSFPILRPVSTPCDKSKQATGELPSCLVDDSFCQTPRPLPASLCSSRLENAETPYPYLGRTLTSQGNCIFPCGAIYGGCTGRDLICTYVYGIK